MKFIFIRRSSANYVYDGYGKFFLKIMHYRCDSLTIFKELMPFLTIFKELLPFLTIFKELLPFLTWNISSKNQNGYKHNTSYILNEISSERCKYDYYLYQDMHAVCIDQ